MIKLQQEWRQIFLAATLAAGASLPATAQEQAPKQTPSAASAAKTTPKPTKSAVLKKSALKPAKNSDRQNGVCQLDNGHIGYIASGDVKDLNIKGLQALLAAADQSVDEDILREQEELRAAGFAVTTQAARATYDLAQAKQAKADIEQAAREEFNNICTTKDFVFDTGIPWPPKDSATKAVQAPDQRP